MSKIKKPTKKQLKATLYVVSVILLVALGVVSTLQYQKFINNVKAEGVAEYQTSKCDKYIDKESPWYECDI